MGTHDPRPPRPGRGTGAIRVAVIDRSPAARDGICAWLGAAGATRVVGAGATAEEGWRLACALALDVLVMDVSPPDASAFDVCRRVVSGCLGAAVLLRTWAERDSELAMGWAAGAAGFVSQLVGAAELLEAVHEAAGGRRLFTPAQRERIRAWEVGQGLRVRSVTRRQAEVLRLLASGPSNAAIAAALVISESTVEKHLAGLAAQLGVSSRAEILALLLRDPWIAQLTGGTAENRDSRAAVFRVEEIHHSDLPVFPCGTPLWVMRRWATSV